MSKIARLFVHRLEQLARRNALHNGLLDLKTIEIDSHVVRHYMPVFDTSSLTGDQDKDLAWVRRHFGDYLQPTAAAFEGTSVPAGLRSGSRRRSNSKNERLSNADLAKRAYALSFIGESDKGPLVSNIIAAIVLARTIERARVTLAAVTHAAAMPAPVIALHAPIIGFEPANRRLIEVPGFLPGGDLMGLDGKYFYDDMTIAGDEGPGRTYVLLLGHSSVALPAPICSVDSSTRCDVTIPLLRSGSGRIYSYVISVSSTTK